MAVVPLHEYRMLAALRKRASAGEIQAGAENSTGPAARLLAPGADSV